MGDEDTVKPKVKEPQRRPKVIIRKCKKSTTATVPKSTEDSKKINGELLFENKGKESNTVEVNKVKNKETVSKSVTKGVKRKLIESVDDDCIVVEDSSSRSEGKIDDESEGKDDCTPSENKGFKKRMLPRTEKLKNVRTDITEQGKSDSIIDSTKESEKPSLRPRIIKISKGKKKIAANGKKGNEGDRDETQAESQTEYAQYLGLQPTMQFKCYRCGEKGFPSMLALNMHQRGCGISQKSSFITNLQQDTTMPPSDPNMLTNFRITRKVYLCSACGTYYENWNLFLHMRDVHKKHICLFCLTMFGIADKLADHLKSTHSVQESTYKSSEEFQNAYKGSCYLICCTCENMFNERENYFHHNCVKRDPTAKCNICGVKCGHYYTCPNSNTPRTVQASLNVSQPIPVTKAQPAGLSKYALTKPAPKNKEELWMGKKGQGRASSDNDEDYDISHAASFCHVDIADESGERDKSGTEDNPVVLSDSEPSKPDEPINNVESKVPESVEEKEEICSNKDIQPDENEPDKSITTAETEHISSGHSTEGSKNENEVMQEEKNSKEEEAVEEVTNVGETITNVENENFETEVRDENVKETELLSENIEQKIEENNKKDDNSKDIIHKSDNCEGNLSQETGSPTNEIETDEVSKTEEDELEPPPQDANEHSVSSDTDGEPVTHLSISQDDSESSSDESSDEEHNKDDSKQSIETNKEDSACESDDSDKSGLVVDEKPKNLINNNDEDSRNQTYKDISEEEDSSQDNRSTSSNQATKDFTLSDIPPTDKQREIGEKENESDNEIQEELHQHPEEINDGIPLASEDVPAMALTLENKLEDVSSQSVVKECVRTSCLNCVYCSHAIKIAVNGKQLALHLLAEHRYKPVKNNETSQDVVKKLKNSLSDLEQLFFNTDSYDSSDKSLNTSYDYTYECFQCRFVTKVHKELYVHKRKMHQKTVLLCVMCKANFYSYSELLCHMCPGIYVSEDINFRCCFCNLDMIPSAFRLMVHLRKSHHTCDICLEVAGDQQKLSTHMWKHKLNHLCYRCGIAYRNKPDITKHLFWKHGTESVLCKKCLQKKWPHVYHFCIPPTVFICEECNASFSKAVALKVHKRFHGGELPHGCSKCDQRFVSKKILRKHEESHNQPFSHDKSTINTNDTHNKHIESSDEHINVESIDEPGVKSNLENSSCKDISKENELKSDAVHELKSKKKKKKDKNKKDKPVLDVYDLPPLNLSSESDSSDEDVKGPVSETTKNKEDSIVFKDTDTQPEKQNEEMETSVGNVEPPEENQTPAPIVDGVWDNFHSYKAELEKRESKDLSLPNILPSTSSSEPKIQPEVILHEEERMPSFTLLDHSYCLIPGKPKPAGNEEEEPTISEPVPVEETSMEVLQETPAPRGHSSSIDHAYATLNNTCAESTLTTPAPSEQPPLDKSAVTPPPPVIQPSEPNSSNKKRQKTPKKKKHNTHSSSSSESSSDSDSSCSCGTNCSCSSTSSNSSSSSSSDSESSTSEGRQKAAVKKEKKKEKAKHKHHKEETNAIPVVPTEPPPSMPPPQPTNLPIKDEHVVDVPIEPVEMPIRESDLDTDESSTDEDFYDKYPQSHAKQQMEKRNKLMLLASVAPVNNGTVSPPPPAPVEKTPPPPPAIKRKIKTKKRRKSQQSKKSTNKSALLHHQGQPSTSDILPTATSTPSHVSTNHHNLIAKVASPLRTPIASFHSDATAGSGSENESARLSKRKRVRNKFYGYSSEEEEHERPVLKWRKVDSVSTPQLPVPGLSFQPSLTIHKPQLPIAHIKRPKPSESSGTDEDTVVKKEEISNSSSSSSESENEIDSKSSVKKDQTEKSDNLYCYCQCPYDEVSEMIACDGQDCTIEWFHFECVGIMVPPKGKWYCPDCRKRRDLM